MDRKVAIEIDLDLARQNAEAARTLLVKLRERYDLSQWEYTQRVRIAPMDVPHSHPVLTLNGRLIRGGNQDEDAFLATYLHEQIHWGLSLHRREETEGAIDRLRSSYPKAHTTFPETARTEQSTYLHLVVNWLEIAAVAEFIGREKAEAQARRRQIYTWIYETVIRDRREIEATLKATAVIPLPPAI